MLKCAPEKSDMLDIFFTQESPNKLPAFMRCNINRESHNIPLYDRQKPIIFSTDGKQDKCINDVIPSGIGNRFYGFSRNIDVDSELKRINRKYDRCNTDNFKLSPNDERSPLFCNRDMLLVGDTKKEKNDSPMTCNRWNL